MANLGDSLDEPDSMRPLIVTGLISSAWTFHWESKRCFETSIINNSLDELIHTQMRFKFSQNTQILK